MLELRPLVGEDLMIHERELLDRTSGRESGREKSKSFRPKEQDFIDGLL